MFKRISESISHITYFTTFLIVSISLGGLIFYDSFTKSLKYDTSILDLDFYTLFIQVIVLDKSIVVGWGLILFIILFIIFEFFPKAMTFFLGIFHFIGLISIKIFKEPFLLLVNAIFMVLFSFVIVFDWIFFNRVSFFLRKIAKNVVFGINKFDHFSQDEQKYIKNKYDMEESYKEYEKGSFWVLFALSILILWLGWLMQFGKISDQYVSKLQNDKEMTHQLFIRSKGDIITIPCMFVSKVKSGYLVMIPSEKNNRPVIYPDSVIYKLEKK